MSRKSGLLNPVPIIEDAWSRWDADEIAFIVHAKLLIRDVVIQDQGPLKYIEMHGAAPEASQVCK